MLQLDNKMFVKHASAAEVRTTTAKYAAKGIAITVTNIMNFMKERLKLTSFMESKDMKNTTAKQKFKM